MSIIGIIGSRRRDGREDFEAIYRVFRHIYTPGDRIVSGGCPKGGDRFAEIIAIQLGKPGHYQLADLLDTKKYPLIKRHHLIKENGAPFILHPARWREFGKAAGFLRNGPIAADSDKLIACVAADRTGGAEDTIRKFLAREGKSEEDLYLV